jgi:hypothetical protein
MKVSAFLGRIDSGTILCISSLGPWSRMEHGVREPSTDDEKISGRPRERRSFSRYIYKGRVGLLEYRHFVLYITLASFQHQLYIQVFLLAQL